MNDLTGKCVNVVLAIEMGRGMSYLEHPIKIVANFNKRSLESDLVKPSDYHIFNTELIWEIEKKELRKLRSSNIPLRIEVLLIGDCQWNDRIGFILLSLRCASVIPSKSEKNISFNWQKLLGVAAEKKSHHPELYLSLTIRDLAMLVPQRPLLTEFTIEEEDMESVVDGINEADSKEILIQYLENGFIQIGNGVGCKKFLLNILLQVASNLDLLLPEALVFSRERGKYFITFKMFGITIKSKPFCRDLHANIPMNEKIVVRILSTYETLQTYLAKYCQITISFYCGDNMLGITNLPVNELTEHVSFKDFLNREASLTYEQECFFKYPSQNGIVPLGGNNRQPFVEVATTLMIIEDQSSLTTNEGKEIPSHEDIDENDNFELDNFQDDTSSNNSIVNSWEEKSENLNVDTSLKNNITHTCRDKTEDLKVDQKVETSLIIVHHDQNNLSTKQEEPLDLASSNTIAGTNLKDVMNFRIDLNKKTEIFTEIQKPAQCITNSNVKTPAFAIKGIEDIHRSITLYQQYCLDVIIETITLKKTLDSKKLYVKFKHPKASSFIKIASENENRVGEDIMLENTRCKIFFVSSDDHIRKMVYAWPPKLLLVDEHDHNLIEELDIYTAMFLAKNKIECSYTTEGKSVLTYEPLVTVSIVMFLQQYGLSALPQQTDLDLLPPILDDNIDLKKLCELYEWKENEKSQFADDLKVLQNRRISVMKRQWEKKEMQLEEKLLKSITRCENLSQELSMAINAIEDKAILKSDYNETNDVSKRKFRNTKLYKTISKLEIINTQLKNNIGEQIREIEHIKNTALTNEQTTSLLQQLRSLEEKLGETEKAKSYFKDQWKKAVKEIHDLRSQDQKQIQEKIQSQKIELSQISLEATDLNFENVNYQDEFDVAFPIPF